MNYDMTEISFSKGVQHHLRRNIVDTVRVKEVDQHAKHLGRPIIISHLKKEIFTCLTDCIWKKLHGWKEKFLSKVGKEVCYSIYCDLYDEYL